MPSTMFPRAPRFDRAKQNDTPVPNSYDPKEMTAHYKKGALNQKDNRFNSSQTSDSDDCGSTSASGTALTTPPRIGATSATVLKERAKMASKVAKSEERIIDLERQVHSLTNEKSRSLAKLSEFGNFLNRGDDF